MIKEMKEEEINEEIKEEEFKDSTEETLKHLENENSDLKDELLRNHAEFENFKRRLNKEKLEAVQFANKNLLNDLVNLLDNLDRAINTIDENMDFKSIHDGITMIENQFLNELETKYGLKKFGKKGDLFNPNIHEAFSMENSDEYEEQTILEVFQKGYMLHDKALRTAKVKVSQS